MSTHELQLAYATALARVGNATVPKTAARHLPIFQRAGAPTQKQAVKDAANALRELWRGPARKSTNRG